MNFKPEQKVKYGVHAAKIKGIIPAFFQIGSFPNGTDDIDIRYLEADWDKSQVDHDTILIQVGEKLIRVAPNALEPIEEKPKKATKKEKK